MAQRLEAPLYVVSAATIGTKAKPAEQFLVEMFHLAHYWRAVLLIDEADVFLEQCGDSMGLE